MFIDGLSEQEKKLLPLHLRTLEHLPFMVIKHATAAVQCERRGTDIHPIDLKYLAILDDAIATLFDKHRMGSTLIYDKALTQTRRDRA